MKQTKKLTWRQKVYLESKCGYTKEDIEGIRLVEDTPKYLKVQLATGVVETYFYQRQEV